MRTRTLPSCSLGLPPLRYSLALLAILLSGCSKVGTDAHTPSPATPPPLPVTVITMQPTQVPITVEVVAQTEGAKETEVRAQVSGILVKQLYPDGAPVKAGQPLFQINRKPYDIALAQARAKLAEAKAKLDQAAREAARLQELLNKQYISRKAYDDAVFDYETARAVQQAAEAAVQQAELNLSYTTVTAPVTGISSRAVKSEGNLISTGAGNESLLTSIYQSNPMWVRFSLSDSDMARLPGGRLTPQTVTGVELKLPDGSAYPLMGQINFFASSIDPTLGTQQFRAEFKNPDGVLLPGQFVRARILAGEREGVFLVPQAAVVQTEQGYRVFIADAENKVAPRPVQVGSWQGKDWVILGGLKAGDSVIIDQLMKLRPGAPVAPHPPPSAPPAPGAAPDSKNTPSAAPATPSGSPAERKD